MRPCHVLTFFNGLNDLEQLLKVMNAKDVHKQGVMSFFSMTKVLSASSMYYINCNVDFFFILDFFKFLFLFAIFFFCNVFYVLQYDSCNSKSIRSELKNAKSQSEKPESGFRNKCSFSNFRIRSFGFSIFGKSGFIPSLKRLVGKYYNCCPLLIP